MGKVSPEIIGRFVIVCAVFLQAVGKVAYGTWLVDFPSPAFVFVSFTLTAALFLGVSGRGIGQMAWGPLLLLNFGTALTFLSFFYALKLIEPAIVGAVEIGIGPLLAMGFTFLLSGDRPSRWRLVVCLGVLVGCGILAVAALHGTGFATSATDAWMGLGASIAAGAGAVVITMASKSLVNKGWKFGAVLAHRFYVILPVSLLLTIAGENMATVDWNGTLVAALIAVSIVGVLAPLYLLQVGIGRCDPYTVMVSMAALPVMTFIIEGLSPVYSWSWLTALGVAVVTAFLILDVTAPKRK